MASVKKPPPLQRSKASEALNLSPNLESLDLAEICCLSCIFANKPFREVLVCVSLSYSNFFQFMKKFLLSAALFCGVASASQAGQLQGVTLSGTPLITVYGGYEQTLPLQANVRITNNSGRTLRLGFQRQIISEVAGSENNFCFGVNCYPATVSTSPTSAAVVLTDGSFDDTAVLDYTPNSNSGITVIRYALYEQGSTDSAYVTVRFDASQRLLATSASRAPESVLSQPWPNPAAAGTAAELRYQLPAGSNGAHLILVSLADGRRVRDIVLPVALAEGSIRLSTNDIAAGLYSCLLIGGAEGRGQLLAARRLHIK
jgi:hypothetical protein